ncbi:hypothetical protein BGZ79_008178 [Entomortierella chlamydospora]|nr:hypothetical protein BGZ79_008178 [Entomortierella chlamydospora]
MTDSDFEDANFDINDISSILKDIDSANLALDSIDVRADKLTASIMSLLKAQSLPNPYANIEPEPLEDEVSVLSVESVTITSEITLDAPSPSTLSKEDSAASEKSSSNSSSPAP